MPNILRKDTDTTQDGALIIGGSANVLVNGKGVVRIGDAVQNHNHGITPITGMVMVTGSSKVFVNGIAVCRVGDLAQAGAVVDSTIGGSPDTKAG